MGISPTAGGTATNPTPGTASTTVTFGAVSLTTGQDITIAVSILDPTISVSGIADTALNTYTLKFSVNNGSAIRVEIWEAHNITGNASDVIVITFSSSVKASAAFEEYAASTAVGNIGTTATGTGFNAEGDVSTQDNGSYAVTAIAVATLSGDTFIANLGTIRRFIIPAATTAGIALVDNTSLLAQSMRNGIVLSASRAWAAASLELRTGVAALVVDASNTMVPIINTNKGAFHQKVSAYVRGVLPSSTSGSASS